MVNVATDAKLTDAILVKVTAAKDNLVAISWLQSELRLDGWRSLGNLSSFESLCERLGFTLVRDVRRGGERTSPVTRYSGRYTGGTVLRTYVTVGK